MDTKLSAELSSLLREFACKPEFEGILLEYQKHSGLDFHKLLIDVLEQFWRMSDDPYNLMDLLLRVARKSAIDTESLRLKVFEVHDLLKRESRSNKARFEQIIGTVRIGVKRDTAPNATRSAMQHQRRQGTAVHKKSWRVVNVAILAANPYGAESARLDREIRDIQTEVVKGTCGTRFCLTSHLAVQIHELQAILLRSKPDIVHFCGHGNHGGEIVVEDRNGSAAPIPAQALVALFQILSKRLRCVVLNACYSDHQAKAIASVIDCVVGMRGVIADDIAVAFSRGFYLGLADDRSVQQAFDMGCSQIALERIKGTHKPHLLTKQGVQADRVFLCRRAPDSR